MGVSGPVGLGQLYCDQVGRLWKSGKLGRKTNLAEVQRLLHDAIGKDASRVLSDVRTISPVIGQQNAMQMCITHSLVAVPVGGHRGHPELIQCDILGNAEVASNDLPYVSVGIGQPLADPFLAFLRRVFWPNTLPNVADGILAVMWTLVHAIAVTPGGVAEPIQIATLSGGEEFKARELAKEEIEEHRQNVLGRRGTFEVVQDGSRSISQITANIFPLAATGVYAVSSLYVRRLPKVP